MALKEIKNTTLKAALRKLFSGDDSYETLRYLINICHKIALSYIWLKTGKTGFKAEKFGMTANDLAFDSIAELFKNDDPQTAFPELNIYFVEHHPFEDLDEPDVLILLRKLVFSSVNHRIFRLYQANDPTLGKLIRNIKLSLKGHPDLELIRMLNNEYIKPRLISGKAHSIRDLTGDELASNFELKPNITLKEILNQIAGALKDNGQEFKKVSLTEAALSIRSLFYQELYQESEPPLPSLLKDEILMFIQDAVAFLETSIIKKYTNTAKLDDKVANSFIAAIRELLIIEFVELNGHEKSYFAHLNAFLPELSEDEYTLKYRTKFEYCAKFAKENLRLMLKTEM